MKTTTLASTVADLMPRARADLERLVRIPSCAFPGFPTAPVLEAAGATADVLRTAGLTDARLLELPGSPAVYGEIPGPPGAPTVLLYAHYDVQPTGPEHLWASPPFELTERDGRLFGRGASDDKSGIVVHAAALAALDGHPPVGIKVLIEGEEESTSEHLPQLIAGNRDLLASDVIVVADSGNVRTGVPTLTTTIRGVVSCIAEVRTLRMPVHSGSYGGVAPDALVALIRMLGSLHDERGDVAVEGLVSTPWTGDEYERAAFRSEAGMLEGVAEIGRGSIGERLWTRPSINVIGLDAPPTADARNILVDVARADVSLRLAPGDDPDRALGLLIRHLERAAPWGAHVQVRPGTPGPGFAARTDGPAYEVARRAMREAYGTEAVAMGSGGSVPLVPTLARTYPEAEILLMGAMDDRSNAHAQDESVDPAEIRRATLAEALLLVGLARR